MRRRNNATGAVVEDETKITCARRVVFDSIARRLAPDGVTTNARPFVATAPATRSGSTNTNDGSVREQRATIAMMDQLTVVTSTSNCAPSIAATIGGRTAAR